MRLDYNFFLEIVAVKLIRKFNKYQLFVNESIIRKY